MRTITQILIDVDNSDNLNDLSVLWGEIYVNINYYITKEVNFCMEHIGAKARELCKGDMQALKELIKLLNSHD